MTEIKYHEARLPDEEDIYEVFYTKGSARGQKNIGSIYFRKTDEGNYKEVDCKLHGTRERDDKIHNAAKRLIRQKNCEVVYDENGEKIAELKEYHD